MVHSLVGIAALLAADGAAAEWSISWSVPNDAVQGFVVERRVPPAKERTLVARLGPTARSFEDDEAPEAERLCYRIRAILADGRWSPSEERCTQRPAAPLAIAPGPVVTIDIATGAPATDELPAVAAPPATPGVDVAAPARPGPDRMADPDATDPALSVVDEPATADIPVLEAPEAVEAVAPPDAPEPGPGPPRVSDRFAPLPAERFFDIRDGARPADAEDPPR